MNPLEQLHALFQDGARQLGFTEHQYPDGRAPVLTPKKAATAASFSLRSLQIAARNVSETGGVSAAEQAAGKQIPISAAIMERSRVAQAGARILVVDPAAEARPVGDGSGTLGFAYQRAQFITVSAAQFAPVPEPAAPALPDLAESAAPVSRIYVGSNGSNIDNFGGPSYGVRFRFTRLQAKEVGLEQMVQELLLAITLGLARVVDHALLSAVLAASPAPFSLGAAAAAGVGFEELRALVGTNGAGAAVSQDGALRAAGISAELSPTVAPTVVGSFGRAGLAMHDSLRISLERKNAAGDLVVTCWSDVEALLPDDSFFWTAA